MSDDLLRIYEPDELGRDGYPLAWHRCPTCGGRGVVGGPATDDGLFEGCEDCLGTGSVKDMIREWMGHRCVRCLHPFRVGESGEWERLPADHKPEDARLFDGTDEVIAVRPHQGINWSDCDERCAHHGPARMIGPFGVIGIDFVGENPATAGECAAKLLKSWPDDPMERRTEHRVQAAWRILTVHHLNGNKADLRWWNLAALCQRCHLYIQRKVKMEQVFPWEHTDWFKPYAAGFYASTYLGEELHRYEVEARLDELLALERVA